MLLFDVENLTHGLPFGPQPIRTAYSEAMGELDIDAAALWGCASAPSSILAPLVGMVRPWLHLRAIVPGPNAADVALLNWFEMQWTVRRVRRLYVLSGDGIFTSAARRVRAAGGEVVVVSRAGRLHRDLRGRASRTVLLPPLEADTDDAQ